MRLSRVFSGFCLQKRDRKRSGRNACRSGPTTKKRLGKSPHAGLPSRTERCHRGSSPSLPEDGKRRTRSSRSGPGKRFLTRANSEPPLQHPLRKPFYSTDSRRYSLQQTNLPATPLPASGSGRPREPRPTRPRTAFRKCSKDCGRRIRHRFSSRKGKLLARIHGNGNTARSRP